MSIIYGDDGSTAIGGRSMAGDWYYLDGVDESTVHPDWVNQNLGVALAHNYVRMDDSGEAELRAAEADMYQPYEEDAAPN
jgi:hypothetical protein